MINAQRKSKFQKVGKNESKNLEVNEMKAKTLMKVKNRGNLCHHELKGILGVQMKLQMDLKN